jgi:hypothetical protein
VNIREIHGIRILFCAAEGPKLANDRDAVELIGHALERRISMIAIPVERFHPDFFRLKTGVAGAFVQKFVIYHVRLAIIGDVSLYLSESPALRDFVQESNRGNHIWFVAGLNELAERIESAS